MSKRGLGRGLSALIPSAAAESHSGEQITELPLASITPNPDQPRTDIDDDAIKELADSIDKVGLLQPIIVRPWGEGYQIIAGERRWRACKLAGLESAPVRVQSSNEVESLMIALIENLQREDLNAIEEARGYKRLLSEYDMTQAELAASVSKSRPTVTNALRLLELPEEVQDLIYGGRLSAGHARAVLSVADEAARIKLANKIVQEGLSVREAENVARLLAMGGSDRTPKPPTPRAFKAVARSLRRLLGTPVKVKQGKDKCKIEIEFHTEEELERIFRLLSEGPAAAEGSE